VPDDDSYRPDAEATAPIDPAVAEVVRLAATSPGRELLATLRARGAVAEPALVASVDGRPAPVVRRRLLDLLDRGLVRRVGDDTGHDPPRYALSAAGAAFGPVLDELDEFRTRHRHR
jgi:hypothetical protein